MPAEDHKGLRSSLVPIEWWPGHWRLSTIVPRALVRFSQVQDLKGTTYADFPYRQGSLLDDHGTWTFGEALASPGPGENIVFVWNPPLTDEDRTTPFHEYHTEQVYPWPAVLEDLQFVRDANNVTLRRFFRNGASVSSLVRVREFVSDTPFPKRRCETNEPIPTEIQGDYNGIPVSIESCLHPRVELISTASDTAVVFDAIPGRTFPRQGKRKVYAKTNHLRWRQHVFHNKTQHDQGLYHRVEMTVYPPARQPITYA